MAHRSYTIDSDTRLFIGGLGSTIREKHLRESSRLTTITQYGAITECVIKEDLQSRKSKGYAFISFTSTECLNRAIDSQPHYLHDRKLDVKKARETIEITQPTNLQSTKIFVGALPEGCTDAMLKKAFYPYGEITAAICIVDHGSGRNRGFGFVQFTDARSVVSVLDDYHEHFIADKWVETKCCLPKEDERYNDQSGYCSNGSVSFHGAQASSRTNFHDASRASNDYPQSPYPSRPVNPVPASFGKGVYYATHHDQGNGPNNSFNHMEHSGRKNKRNYYCTSDSHLFSASDTEHPPTNYIAKGGFNMNLPRPFAISGKGSQPANKGHHELLSSVHRNHADVDRVAGYNSPNLKYPRAAKMSYDHPAYDYRNPNVGINSTGANEYYNDYKHASTMNGYGHVPNYPQPFYPPSGLPHHLPHGVELPGDGKASMRPAPMMHPDAAGPSANYYDYYPNQFEHYANLHRHEVPPPIAPAELFPVVNDFEPTSENSNSNLINDDNVAAQVRDLLLRESQENKSPDSSANDSSANDSSIEPTSSHNSFTNDNPTLLLDDSTNQQLSDGNGGSQSDMQDAKTVNKQLVKALDSLSSGQPRSPFGDRVSVPEVCAPENSSSSSILQLESN